MLMQPVSILVDARATEVSAVARNLRPSDLYEAECAGFDDGAHLVGAINQMVARCDDVFTVVLRGRPVFIFGTVALSERVRQLIGFGTRDTRRVIPRVTRFVRETWLPGMKARGVRRIQVLIPASNTTSVNWLKSFGMVHECDMPDYAANGALMQQYAFTSKEFEHVLLR